MKKKKSKPGTINKKSSARSQDTKENKKDSSTISSGSGNAFEATENPTDESDKELSDEQLDDLLEE